MFAATIVANDILKLSNRDSIPVTPMKLQKLMYFIFGQYYAEMDEPLFAENFVAWQYGPVISSVYQEFKQYGGMPIGNYARDAQGDAWFSKDCEENYDYRRILYGVWEKLKHKSGIELSYMTHTEGTPWASTLCNGIISNDKIKAYFKEHPVYGK